MLECVPVEDDFPVRVKTKWASASKKSVLERALEDCFFLLFVGRRGHESGHAGRQAAQFLKVI